METTAEQAEREERGGASVNRVDVQGLVPVVQKFINERTYKQDGVSVMSSDVLAAFAAWYAGPRIPSPTQFGIIMRQHLGVPGRRTKRGTCYVGIALKMSD